MSVCLQKVRIDGKTVQLFDDDGKVTGYSFSQDKYYPDPLDQLPKDFVAVKYIKTEEEIEEEIDDITSYQTKDVPSRNLEASSLRRFGVKTGLSEADGESVTTLHFPITKDSTLVGYKNKLLAPKRNWNTGVAKGIDLFGWKQAIDAGSPKLFITEGEADAVAAYQMLKQNSAGTKWSHLEPSIVSITNGAGGAKNQLVAKQAEIFKHFQEVVLLFDMDEPGQQAAEAVVKVLPHTTVATLPRNDANECLIENRIRGFCRAVLFNSSKPKNTRLIKGSSLSVAAKTPPVWGLSYPWSGLTSKTKGIRRGEIIIIGAGVAMGKSILLSALAADMIVEHNNPVLIVKAEEAAVKTYQELVAQVASRRFNDPSLKFDEEAYDLADAKIKDKAIIVDSYQFIDFDTLKVDINDAIVNEGVKDIYIDPLTCLVNDMSASEANELLNKAMAELAAIAKDMDVTFYMFSHLNNPKSGAPHEEGGAVHVNQLTNSRGMMRSAHMILGLEGNKSPDLPEDERNMRQLVLLKDREHGQTGRINLWWSKTSGKFEEIAG